MTMPKSVCKTLEQRKTEVSVFVFIKSEASSSQTILSFTHKQMSESILK